MRLTAVLTVLLAIALAGAAPAQTVRAVAVADFVDESTDGIYIGASRLNAVLEQVLSDRAERRLRVVPVNAVRTAMKAQGVTPRDLVSPTRAIAVARAVGAEWIVTGRWTHLESDDLNGDPPGVRILRVRGHGRLEIRVLEAATRRVILEEAFGGDAVGSSRLAVLVEAAVEALHRAADGIFSL